MSPANTPKLRFSDVAYAIQTSPKSLRNWLQRGQVKLQSKQDDGWREFTYADVAILALVRKLVDFGLKVEDASALGRTMLMQMDSEFARQAASLHRLFPKVWEGHAALVWIEPQKGVWLSRIVARDVPHFIKLPHGHAPTRPPKDIPSAYIALDVHAVLSQSFERAHESATDGADDE